MKEPKLANLLHFCLLIFNNFSDHIDFKTIFSSSLNYLSVCGNGRMSAVSVEA